MSESVSYKNTSIKKKSIMLSLVIPGLLVLVLIGVLFFIQFRNAFDQKKKDLRNESVSLASIIQIELSQSFEMIRNIVNNPLTARVIERMDTLPDGLDNDDFLILDEADELVELMETTRKSTNAALLYTCALETGGMILSNDTQIPEGFDVRVRDYYNDALKSPGNTVMSSPRAAAIKSSTPVITVTAARSVENEAGKSVGVLALNYNFDPIINILKKAIDETGANIMLYDFESECLLWSDLDNETYFYNPDKVYSLADLMTQMGLSGDEAKDSAGSVAREEESFFVAKAQHRQFYGSVYPHPGNEMGHHNVFPPG